MDRAPPQVVLRLGGRTELNRESEAAILGYLEHELQTSYRNTITILKRQTDLTAATHSFMIHVEGPGIPNEGDRQSHARIALEQYTLTNQPMSPQPGVSP